MRKFPLLFVPLLFSTLANASFVGITTTSLPFGTLGQSYSGTIVASGGTTPYTWSYSGALPLGLSSAVSSKTTQFIISGVPSVAGTYSITVTVRGHGGHTSTRTFSIVVAASRVVTISPSTVTLNSNGQQQFTASGGMVSWSATCGVVNFTGLYTAPTVTTQSTCGVTATSTLDPTKYGTATVTVNPPAQHTVDLIWNESSTTVISFNVYRGLSSGGPYSLIQNGVAATLYTDTTVGSGIQYFYVVAGVDNLGVESPYSNETTAIVP